MVDSYDLFYQRLVRVHKLVHPCTFDDSLSPGKAYIETLVLSGDHCSFEPSAHNIGTLAEHNPSDPPVLHPTVPAFENSDVGELEALFPLFSDFFLEVALQISGKLQQPNHTILPFLVKFRTDGGSYAACFIP